MTDTDNLANRMREAAMAATPGEWTVWEYGDGDSLVIHSDDVNRVCFMATPGDSPNAMARIAANAAHIVAAQPANVLALLDEREVPLLTPIAPPTDSAVAATAAESPASRIPAT